MNTDWSSRNLVRECFSLVGKQVKVAGWVAARRDHGKIIFIDLRDRSGMLQVVFTPLQPDVSGLQVGEESGIQKINEKPQPLGRVVTGLTPAIKETYEIASGLRDEWVVLIEGTIAERPKGMQNPESPNGTIELQAESLTVLNPANTPPFPVTGDGKDIEEELRLKYRYLDLRRPRLQENLRMRNEVTLFMRNWLKVRDFIEVETPILTKGTPEGAREFLVPSRIYPGKFYVLPQSPQQYKQLLMVAGLERYFQIARCFRDEDQRGDRQPEFTQLDVEMSFVSQEEVLQLGEELFTEMTRALFPEKHLTFEPWPRLTYKEAMERYGTDKPDLRKNTADQNELAFAFVVDFPMFEKGVDGALQPSHHPFTTPNPEDLAKLDSDPLSVRAWSYDIVLNGFEVSSGSIRIHNRTLQEKIFAILGLTPEKTKEKFGHILEAFEYGAPPHGGFAPGIDRIAMILAGEGSISEVIAFPKTGTARDPMMGSPSTIEPKQLRELGL